MTFQSVHFPVFVSRKPPYFDCFIVGSRGQNLHLGMERDPINSFLMSFNDMLNFNLGSSVQLIGLGALLAHHLLFKLIEIPDSNRLIKTATGNQGVLHREGGAHHVVRVASQDGDARSILPIPYSNRLVVGGRDDPGEFSVELHCTHVVQMTREREKALFQLVVPHFYHVVITS